MTTATKINPAELSTEAREYASKFVCDLAKGIAWKRDLLKTAKTTDYVILIGESKVPVNYESVKRGAMMGSLAHATVFTKAEATRLAPTFKNGKGECGVAVSFKKALTDSINDAIDMMVEWVPASIGNRN
jgi:hypothetical protein